MLDSGSPRRVWINQPSTLQLHHALHGKKAIAIPEQGDYVTVYFCDGPVISMQIAKLALSLDE